MNKNTNYCKSCDRITNNKNMCLICPDCCRGLCEECAVDSLGEQVCFTCSEVRAESNEDEDD